MTNERRLTSILVLFALFTAEKSTAILSTEGNLPENGGTGAPEMEEIDDRTYLDLFGAGAKEYLTQQVIPDTDAECRWNWNYGRCEPNCECHFQPLWGDYHVGRACRLRAPQTKGSTATTTTAAPPLFCDAPPETKYAVLVRSTLERTRAITTHTRTRIALWKNRIQTETCGDLPTECSGIDEANRRSLKERLLCRHVPSPCDESTVEEEVSLFIERAGGEPAGARTEADMNASLALPLEDNVQTEVNDE